MMNLKKRNNKGFTLIELMIVVAIIAIIAAIAIPNLLRSRMQSNESSAIGDLRTIVGAQVAYHAANFEYTGDFADLTDDSSGPAYLVGSWTNGMVKSGYTFNLEDQDGDGSNFAATADPTNMGTTGNKGFFTDASGVIRYEDAAAADENSTPIGQV